jgi:peptide/nickel transport system ATP-binding protein
MYAQEPLIQVNELNTWYPIKKGILQRTTDFVKAVNGVSFNIYKGETLGLVGESGCGKSTLGRTLVGLEKSTGGSISYLGIDLNSLTREQRKEYRRKVQIIFQDPFSSLNPRVRIGEAISEPMRVHGLYKNTAERMEVSAQLLERVGLKADNLNRFPHEFSGGQRQRVSIARTLALKPEVVICDESVSALDVSVQAQVLNLLNDLKEELGLTFLFISHDLSVVKYMSDRVMVMNKGLIEELQEADALYSAPKSTYAESLISATF